MTDAVDWLARLRQATQDVADDPRDRHAELRRVQALLGLGRYGLARRTVDLYLRRAPDDARALDMLAAAELYLGHHEAAAAAAERALAAEPDYCPARYNLACALAHLGRAAEALDALAEAIAADGDLRDLARDDPDLAGLADDPRFRALVAPGAPDRPPEPAPDGGARGS